jgi:hypothetical protein
LGVRRDDVVIISISRWDNTIHLETKAWMRMARRLNVPVRRMEMSFTEKMFHGAFKARGVQWRTCAEGRVVSEMRDKLQSQQVQEDVVKLFPNPDDRGYRLLPYYPRGG